MLKLNLPNYNKELEAANHYYKKLKNRFKKIKKNISFTDKEHDQILEDITQTLFYVGDLSIPYFDVRDEIETYYTLKYKDTAALANEMWQNEYNKIHEPFNLIKNRCFKLIDDIDEEFIKKNKRLPLNFNI